MYRSEGEFANPVGQINDLLTLCTAPKQPNSEKCGAARRLSAGTGSIEAAPVCDCDGAILADRRVRGHRQLGWCRLYPRTAARAIGRHLRRTDLARFLGTQARGHCA